MIKQVYGKSEVSYDCEDGRAVSFTLLTSYEYGIKEVTVSIRPKNSEAACTEERSARINLNALGKEPMTSFATIVGAARGFANLMDTDLTDEALDEVGKDCAALARLVCCE